MYVYVAFKSIYTGCVDLDRRVVYYTYVGWLLVSTYVPFIPFYIGKERVFGIRVKKIVAFELVFVKMKSVDFVTRIILVGTYELVQYLYCTLCFYIVAWNFPSFPRPSVCLTYFFSPSSSSSNEATHVWNLKTVKELGAYSL